MKPIFKVFSVIFALLISFSIHADQNCKGEFLNPISDLNWSNVYPISLAGGLTLNNSGNTSPLLETVPSVCSCMGHFGFQTPGVGSQLWETVGVLEVTDNAGCLHMLEGTRLTNAPELNGSSTKDTWGHVKKQVHYYQYPVLSLLKMFTDFTCMSTGEFAFGYATEFDPLWNSPWATLLSPENVLFATKAGVLSCIADAVSSNIKYTGPLDVLFWCNGNSTFTNLAGYTTGNDQSEGYIQLAQKFIAKMHKMFIFWGTIGPWAVCQAVPTYIPIKSQYRFNPVWPRARTSGDAITWGKSVAYWNVGNTYSKNTERGMSFFLWRDKQCCVNP